MIRHRRSPRLAGPGAALLLTLLLAGCVGGGGSAGGGGGGCATPASLADRDDDLAVFGSACADAVTFSEGGESWTIQTFRNGSGPLFVVPHDDENAALATAAAALKRYGGTVAMVETGGARFNGRIDPNRNFDGGRLSCGKAGRSPQFVAAMLPGGRPIVGLHTNSRGSARTGGSGTISIRSPYAGAEAFPASGPLAGEDAMVILASRDGAKSVRNQVQRLNAAGVNVMVETVDLAKTDCSLSHYAAANGIPYANVEAAHGDGATQKAILDIVMRTL
ncbi:hypothetical protein [Acuticoccus sp. I52.16.1]|uniref:hypothetical protein n=1 Tax=Acuticoccus sp. I52.16.1 TaxID=2928472 RepID=UPI001FD1F4A0|nr:hypothetical protein [Acuticoccus sp. I52.16.1]UOM34127.1 hypothetical protein MRB58_20220 [Acuticoccus sp. I52.16.1]